ncbi:MAG: YicC/YloC family endoribonuclease [Myxococcota bacterium]|nr:YicC/YloC family endoribonuclease [Myxococcota bacterium]
MGAVDSMTGFGRSRFEFAGVTYRVEIRTVNHRNMNTRCHIPAPFIDGQQPVQALVKRRLNRGAVDVKVQADGSTDKTAALRINEDGIRSLMTSLGTLADELGCPPPGLEAALRFPDLISWEAEEVEAGAANTALLAGVEEALEGVETLRREEGSVLARDLLIRLNAVDSGLEKLEDSAPGVLEAYENRLRGRLQEAADKQGLEVDEGRLVTELVVFSDRCDITEEIVRARAHVAQMTSLVSGEGEDRERGKRLDFLAQELGRELNTVGAKCRDAGMAGAVVDAKVELERIREQVQNIV